LLRGVVIVDLRRGRDKLIFRRLGSMERGTAWRLSVSGDWVGARGMVGRWIGMRRMGHGTRRRWVIE
jgi:hypothetical protein